MRIIFTTFIALIVLSTNSSFLEARVIPAPKRVSDVRSTSVIVSKNNTASVRVSSPTDVVLEPNANKTIAVLPSGTVSDVESEHGDWLKISSIAGKFIWCQALNLNAMLPGSSPGTYYRGPGTYYNS
jgi:hypothetical protein